MGLTYVPVALKALSGVSPAHEALFLVDTGVADSPPPADKRHRIGVQEESKAVHELADGGDEEHVVGLVRIAIMGEVTAGRVILELSGAQPRLSVTALESVGVTIDPTSRTLKRLPAVPLK